MPLSWNEIKDRAFAFSREWDQAHSERAEAQTFWNAFFEVFGVSRRRVATFEKPVAKSNHHSGFIDLLWKGILLIEHKSRGKDLDRAFSQATDYFPGLPERDLPRYILVSDFARFRLYDLEEHWQQEFALADFYQHVHLFGFIAGYQTTHYDEQDPVNVAAAERMGKLHDQLKAVGYHGHALEVYLVRLLFCLFAEDTSLFERRQLQDLIEQRTATDGQDLAQWLAHLFEVLNTPAEKRLTRLDEQLAAFPYVNGSLFAEHLPIAAFDTAMRDLLLEACALDWSRISPAIFGALFQSVMDSQRRRHLGAHYTSEKNILKVIQPLFLDELRAEFERIQQQPRRLMEFHQRLSRLRFLDPACGCGNFLVIAYRELRLLELDVLKALHRFQPDGSLDVAEFQILCDVNQFYGIEIEEFPAQIAQTALWLMDHQMNLKVSEAFGNYFVRLPLKNAATIVQGNALQLDWREIVQPEDLSFILRNPPFGGFHLQQKSQRTDMLKVLSDVKNAGILDYVAAWFRKATDYMAYHPKIKTAFVATNSITQGEQVGVLWPDLLRRGVKIHFAHRTFRWTSEAKGKAAVHCVIIGFALFDSTEKRIFDYETPQAEPHEIKTTNINPYLADAPNILLLDRGTPICQVPEMIKGSQPTDGGNLLLSEAEKTALLEKEPEAARWLKPFIGAKEFLHNEKRWCLWLEGIAPDQLKKLPLVLERVQKVRQMRLASAKAATVKLADIPTLFSEIRQPESDYLLIPSVSSERRKYIPIGFMTAETIASNLCLVIPNATLYHFGILSSAMHMAWTRAVCGRLKSDYRYSIGIVYNNFPWPPERGIPPNPPFAKGGTPAKEGTMNPPLQKGGARSAGGFPIEKAAQHILDTRAQYPNAALADLYDPLTMPADLVKAHQALDNAVDAAYSTQKFTGDRDRVAFLLALYQQLVAPLDAPTPKRRKRATPS